MSGSTVDASYPTASYRFTTSGQGQKNSRGTFDSNEYYGFDFKNEDNKQYLGPTPTSAAVGNNQQYNKRNSQFLSKVDLME